MYTKKPLYNYSVQHNNYSPTDHRVQQALIPILAWLCRTYPRPFQDRLGEREAVREGVREGGREGGSEGRRERGRQRGKEGERQEGGASKHQ